MAADIKIKKQTFGLDEKTIKEIDVLSKEYRMGKSQLIRKLVMDETKRLKEQNI